MTAVHVALSRAIYCATVRSLTHCIQQVINLMAVRPNRLTQIYYPSENVEILISGTVTGNGRHIYDDVFMCGEGRT